MAELHRRVAITGIGLVTALGAGRERTWTALLGGACGIRPVTVFSSEGYRSHLAGEVDMTDVDAPFTALERRRWSRSDRMGVSAATEALADAGLFDSSVERSRVGVFLGAGTADLLRNEDFHTDWRTHGLARTRQSDVWNHFSSTPVDVIAGRFGLEGPRACIVAACSSSTMAIGQAVDSIRNGSADAAIAGGTDALARLTYSGFSALRLMDPEPCRPFDRGRAGMNIGEGAGILVLEEMTRAQARGAHIYGELAGYSMSCEAFHPTAPEPEGRAVAALCAAALADARVDAGDVGHVNAHGTATAQNDAAEARAFARLFGARTRDVPVTSIKSMVAHCLGAAGGIEAAVLALTVARGVMPPTIHHTETDPDCAVTIVANQPREQRVQCAISTSLAFGGNDSAIVIRAV